MNNIFKFVRAHALEGLLAIGILAGVAWTLGVFQILFTSPLDLPVMPPEEAAKKRIEKLNPDGISVNFKDVYYGKVWVANFEIINGTSQPMFYVGSKDRDQSAYCTLAVGRDESAGTPSFEVYSVELRDHCMWSTAMALQTVGPGEKLHLSVSEPEVRELLNIKDKNKETKTRVGFEFFVGKEKRRTILWSEEITFPPDKYQMLEKLSGGPHQ